jgi:hypothetical protein
VATWSEVAVYSHTSPKERVSDYLLKSLALREVSTATSEIYVAGPTLAHFVKPSSN